MPRFRHDHEGRDSRDETSPAGEIATGRVRIPHTYLTRTFDRLHHFFERTVDSEPGALALICAGERLSYAELDARANRLAHRLARSDVRPGDRVGLLFERSLHAYIALLAALKCGATFVP